MQIVPYEIIQPSDTVSNRRKFIIRIESFAELESINQKVIESF